MRSYERRVLPKAYCFRVFYNFVISFFFFFSIGYSKFERQPEKENLFFTNDIRTRILYGFERSSCTVRTTYKIDHQVGKCNHSDFWRLSSFSMYSVRTILQTYGSSWKRFHSTRTCQKQMHAETGCLVVKIYFIA